MAPQDLVDTTFPTFNFDVLYAEGNTLRYEIDVTKPVGSRIVNLTYKGAPLNPTTQFLVVTNNYRASGGGDFGLAGGKGDIVLQAPDASRDVLISYIKRHPRWTWPPMAWTTAGASSNWLARPDRWCSHRCRAHWRWPRHMAWAMCPCMTPRRTR